MNKIKNILKNRWVGFSLVTILYVLWFVVWTGNLWMLLGVVFIFDAYITRYLYRFIGSKNEELCKRSSIYNSIYEWVNAIIFATVVATVIHLFVFQIYVIPSSSMEKSLLVGDYLYVSKITYGPKMPNTPLSFPLVHNTMPFSQTKKSFSEAIKWPYHRLKGLRKIEHNDAVVFNFPAGDTVLLENPAITYYDVLRDYQRQYGNERGRKLLEENYTIISRPVDKRENYIKRCVAVAGDSIRIVDAQLYVNGEKQADLPESQLCYTVRTSSPLSKYALQNLGISELSSNGNHYFMPLTASMAAELGKMSSVISITPYRTTEQAFPYSENYPWTADNFGPLWIPQRGVTIPLTTEILPLYERIIDVYEDNELEVRDGEIFINGKKSDTYTFKMDYFWMMGDNRHNSADSRYWGFVPEDHIVGKASFICFSQDKEKSFPQSIRWNRLFNKVR